jgi:agmatinase
MEIVYPNFLGQPPVQTDPNLAGAMVLPLPVDITASWGRGTDRGPAAIIAASHHLELYDEELDLDVCERLNGVATHPEVALPSDPAEASAAIRALAEPLVTPNRILMSLGGEHAVTWPVVEAHRATWPDLCVVQIDAHADMRADYMGSIYNHACPMRRLMESGVHITSVGIRSMDSSERQFLRSDRSRIWLAHEIAGRLIDRAATIIDQLPSDHVYLTIDLDGLDPSICPAVGTPVPGGLGWYETLHFIRELARRREIVGADVVELSPRQDLHLSDAVAAKLVYKILGYRVASGPLTAGPEDGR